MSRLLSEHLVRLLADRSVLHFSCYWNLSGEWDPHAPEGMRLWAEGHWRSFRKAPRIRSSTWYGKLSIRTLGIPGDRDTIDALNERIQKQNKEGVETRLYLYTFSMYKDMKVPYSLHVGKVTQLAGQRIYDDPEERKHVPTQFYESMFNKDEELQRRKPIFEAIPFFFKLTDLRELNIVDAANLRKAVQKTDYEFEDFRWDNTQSPAFVVEKRQTPNRFDAKEFSWKEVLKTAEELDPGKFRNQKVKAVYYQALQYAALNLPVLIRGEIGTGKTFLARFIRRNSSYCQGKYSENWPLVSCGDFATAGDLDQYLFGADGILAKSKGETVVLDGVEHMPDFLQRKVLNEFDQQARVEAASNGSTKTFRLVACTSIPRDQLSHRLNAHFLDRMATILDMPPIRDLLEDKALCWEYVYDQTKRTLFGSDVIPSLDEEESLALLDSLKRQVLPGNFRDLTRIAIKLILELKFRETMSEDKEKPRLQPDRLIREAIHLLEPRRETDQERAKTLALWFTNDWPFETAFKVSTIDDVKKLVDKTLTPWVKHYVRSHLSRAAQEGDTEAAKFIKKHEPWMTKYKTPSSEE